jgi:hypothetical protein
MKARLRISAFRDSAAARARRADSSTPDCDTPPPMIPIFAACITRSLSDFCTKSLCARWIKSSCWRHYSTPAEVVGRVGSSAWGISVVPRSTRFIFSVIIIRASCSACCTSDFNQTNSRKSPSVICIRASV